ncbi:MAG: hypothetical protein KQH83_11425 [Actinobacteria bacterium]|nr:hypothetical protein [Actinomycetota bacterium]
MVGPIVLVVAAVTAGALSAGWAGAIGAGIAALALVGAVAAGAAAWARRIGSMLDPDEALRLAPRPLGFGRMVDAITRRSLEIGPPEE